MKRIIRLATISAAVASLLMGCNKFGKDSVAPAFVEAEKCSETVRVSIAPETKVVSAAGVEGYTATCIDNTPLSGNAMVLVGYHGIDGVQKGMAQLINMNDKVSVKSEIDVLDARVNTVKYVGFGGKHYAVIGVDRPGKNMILCGVIIVEIVDGKFVVNDETLAPYKVEGVSVNSIAWPQGSEVIFTAAGGNDALVNKGEDGLAGFTKFGIFEADGALKLTLLASQVSTNYRGYCINWDNSNENGLLTYSYRKVDGNDLVWMIGAVNKIDRKELKNLDGVFLEGNCEEIEVYREAETTVNKGKFSVMSTYQNNRNWIVATAGKGGIKVYHHNKTVDNDNFEGEEGAHTLDLIKSIDKLAVSGSMFSKYLYTASSKSCYKYEFVFEGGMLKDVKTIGRVRKDEWPSVNYVCVNGKQNYVYVAAGESGLVRYKCDSADFVPSSDDL